jgi:hypothetical protein
MTRFWIDAATSAGAVTLYMALLAGLLTLSGRISRRLGDVLCRAPGLDVAVAAVTWVPWVAAGVLRGWAGVLGAVVGQVVAYFLWVTAHELAHREAVRGPRIVKVLNHIVGRWRNHAALWATMIGLPAFWHFRFVELFCYPLLVRLLKFPRYNHAEWVNVSRQKFDGLVGHDLFWCLYCDWMTGVTSLGIEMLRNVESFWCPIRFASGKKCANCRIDYPDIDAGWVPAHATMTDVTQKLEHMYAHGHRSWFGHPARLTIRGQDAPQQPTHAAPAPAPEVVEV